MLLFAPHFCADQPGLPHCCLPPSAATLGNPGSLLDCWQVGMYEDAVMLALTFDGDLAASIARQPEGDEALSRKLWLAIARHLIQQGAAEDGTPKVGVMTVCATVPLLYSCFGHDALCGRSWSSSTQPTSNTPPCNPSLPCSALPRPAPHPPARPPQPERIRAVTALLESARGAVRIEDILPLFPDFVEIDAFKDAICRWVLPGCWRLAAVGWVLALLLAAGRCLAGCSAGCWALCAACQGFNTCLPYGPVHNA